MTGGPLRNESVDNTSFCRMDALLVFPYFLVKLFARLGLDPACAEWSSAILSCVCLVSVLMAPFHPRPWMKTAMAGASWIIIVLAATGCVWECRDAQRAAAQRQTSWPKTQDELPERRMVTLGEA